MGHVGARKRARAGDATAPSRHGVKTYLYPYRYTKKASLKPIEPTRTGSVTDATDPIAWPPANESAGQPTWVPLSRPAGIGLPAFSALNSSSACVWSHSTASPALVS